ncbi:putative SCF complex member Cullin 1 [Ceraceosorus guamensis]|uniref:Cullin-1 n=1 Tax=Ceraceosorus guamensis TaxID=1522189 RepID=A0A316VW43_9BASI|nr:putative SCF complex member Cullin 1 [Ceraceosorus guamensis]PWN40521.1 putative SCF complex member Cullin 1 [Ceraceosorus guamensis]
MATANGRTQLPSPFDIDQTWQFLEVGISVMMARRTEGLSYTRYMELYTVVYNYCTSSRMNAPSDGLSGGARGANLVGADMYRRLSSYFVEHSKGVAQCAADLSGEALLKYYVSEWDRYTTGSNFVHRLFTYLNRHWVRREREEGHRHVHFIYTLALVQWKEQMFTVVQKNGRLVTALLNQIEKQRTGETIETSLVKKVVDSFVSLGLDETDSTKQNLEVYRYDFERAFLQATEIYYEAESKNFVAKNSTTDYMKKAEARLREEEGRVEMYLHPTTTAKLVSTCDNVLIRNHSQLLWDEFQALLDAAKTDDLWRMYTLLFRIPEGLQPLRERFEAHVKRVGLNAVEKACAGGAEGSAASEVDPTAYVNALLEVYASSLKTIQNAFRTEAGFLAALDKACRDLMNRNKATGASNSKSPELLARHADGLLKKSNRSAEEANMEEALNQVMIVFKYIEDKDVFQKFYSKMLAKRLVNFTSASDDAESSMISKLKEACGFEYTSKLQRMFTDMGLSKELNDNFRNSTTSQGDDATGAEMDFYVLVLANGFWPLPHATTEIVIPTELLPTYTRFERYYGAKHSGRKLTWMWQLAKTEIRTNYLSQKLIFQLSAYQTAVILQFNASDSLTYTQLREATGLADANLKPALVPLVKSKVLRQDDDAYELNTEFKSKKVRVNLNMPMKAEQKAESSDVMKTVDEDRRMLLQATIVRIMKARKQLKHMQLVAEVISQVSARFQPKVPDIKKAIDQLIDKEYLERVEDQRDLYQYLA